MLKVLLTMFGAVALIAAGSIAASASQANANSHVTRHHNVAHSSNGITSFSSSSVLHVGVNRPPKNR